MASTEETLQILESKFARANHLKAQSHFQEAITFYEEMLAIHPALAPVWNNLGNCYYAVGDFEKALQSLKKALEIEPQFPEARFNLGCQLLLRGDFVRGWEEFEHRLETDIYQGYRARFTKPRWTGELARQSRLLVYAEQGFGDSIQMVRFLPELKRRVGTVILYAQPDLARLFAQLPGMDAFVSLEQPVPEHDIQVSLYSLAAVLRLKPEEFSTTASYLSADPVLVDRWQNQIQDEAKLQIGICWSGNPAQSRNKIRASSMNYFHRFTGRSDLQLYNFQKRLIPAESTQLHNWGIIDVSEQFHDFADTAEAMSSMDLVLTTDTSVAHLAGALGKPTWLLLSHSPDWRWLIEGDRNPWYPSMLQFRQDSAGDWESVFRKVELALDLVLKQQRLQLDANCAAHQPK